MSDYIKREDAKNAVINIVGWEKIAKYVDEMSKHLSTKDIDYYDALIDAEDAIDDLPTADVAPVRHGRWEGCKGDITCSACGEYALYDSEDIEMQYRTLYCPFCGAKMDEGGTDGTDDK